MKKTTTNKKSGQPQGLTFSGGSLFSPLLGGEIIATQDLFYKLFRKNTDIQSSVRKIQSSVGQSGYFIEKNGERYEDPLTKVFLKNFRTTKGQILQHLWVSGNVFVLIVPGLLGDIIDLQVLDPRTMTIVADKYGNIYKYIQRSGTNLKEYQPEEIFHLVEMKDPDNEILGLSRIETLIYDVMGDNEAMISNYSFFKNASIPSSIIILEDNITPAQYEEAIKQLKAQFSGGANRHKVSANTGIKDIKTIGQNNKDMEFLELRRFTKDKVCAAMSVPPTLLGYHEDVNYSTGNNQYRTFIEEIIQPLEDIISEFVSDILHTNNPEYTFRFIDDRNFDRSDRINEYEKMINTGLITINEVREEMGYEKFNIDAADKPIIKVGYEFVDDIGTTELLPTNQ